MSHQVGFLIPKEKSCPSLVVESVMQTFKNQNASGRWKVQASTTKPQATPWPNVWKREGEKGLGRGERNFCASLLHFHLAPSWEVLGRERENSLYYIIAPFQEDSGWSDWSYLHIHWLSLMMGVTVVRITSRFDDKFMVGKLDTSVLFASICLVLSIASGI